MVQHLSPEWVEQLATAGAALPERPGATARLQHVVAGTPDGEVAYSLAYVDGRITGSAYGRDDAAADCTFLVTYKDALAMAKGDLTLEVGFMQGRVKMTGPSGPWFAVQAALQSADHASMLAKLATDTDL